MRLKRKTTLKSKRPSFTLIDWDLGETVKINIMAFYSGNDTDLLVSGESQPDLNDETELLSAQEAVKKLEEVSQYLVKLYGIN